MLSISDLRKYFIPTFHHSVQDVHERLAVQTYQPVKDFLKTRNPELESDLFVECFIMIRFLVRNITEVILLLSAAYQEAHNVYLPPLLVI